MRLQKLGIVFVLLLIAAAGTGAFFYTQYQLRGHQEYLTRRPPSAKDIENAKGQMLTLTESHGGERKWVLKVKQLQYGGSNNVAQLTQVQGVMYDDKQKVQFTFDSPSGTFYKSDSRFILTQGVRMFSPDVKVLIASPQMEWSSKASVITATGGVMMSKEDFGTSKADKALFSMDFTKIQFVGGATSVIGGQDKNAKKTQVGLSG